MGQKETSDGDADLTICHSPTKLALGEPRVGGNGWALRPES